ncbi:NAD regulator [soil metagenome]
METDRRAAEPMAAPATLRLNAVIVSVVDTTPRVLTVRHRDGQPSLPYGLLRDDDRTLDRALRRWVGEQSGLELGYVEQLYTFGDIGRDPGETARALSVAYLALVQPTAASVDAEWIDTYDLLPWEDWRTGRPAVLDAALLPALSAWVDAADDPACRVRRRDRVDIAFGVDPAWDGVRVLDRYELLWEAGLVPEAQQDRGSRGAEAAAVEAAEAQTVARVWQGQPLALDHRRIAATALGRLRGKLTYRPVVFELLPPTFTLRRLQQVVEALAGVSLHTQNFRRLVDRGGFVEGTGEFEEQTGGRPAERFRFRPEVLRERPRPGLGLPRRT